MDMMPMHGIPFPGMYVRPMPEEQRPLAMAFITPQPQISNVYAAEEGLRMGTLFPELYKPFTGKRGNQ
jgi:hypothetical protein